MKKIRLVYMGTPEFAVPPLAALLNDPAFEVLAVVSQPDKAQGRRKEVIPTPVKTLAFQHNIPVLQPLKMRDGVLREALRGLDADFLLTCAFGRILPDDILSLPKCEALNLHASLLPKYRGAAPIQFALLNGDAYTGVSLMRMDAELDHGAVFSQRELEISDKMYYPELSAALANLAAEMAVTDLPRIISGALSGVEQAHEQASFTRLLKKEDGQINWHSDAQTIAQLVRATYPWPGAYGYLGAKRLKIHRAHVIAPELWTIVPSELQAFAAGALIKAKKQGLFVRCGADEPSLLQLEEVQLEGAKRLTAKDFSLGIKDGEVLS